MHQTRPARPRFRLAMMPASLALVIGTLCLVVPGGNGQAATVDLHIMSFNIRNDDGSLGNRASANGWYKLFSTSGGRKDLAVSTISSYGPDLLGTEEVLPNQLADLQAAFPGYGYYGDGRDGNNLGEHSGIFYRASRFTPVAHGDFWLSATPTVPGTTFTGNGTDTGNPRIASWIKLTDNQSHQTYFVLNTHWSLDSLARSQSATLIRNEINQLSGGLPLIVMGDFNTDLSSSALQTLTGVNIPGFDLSDSYRQVFPTVGPNEATFHNFTGNQAGVAIDHIFSTPTVFTATAAEIVHTSYNGKYPSDHFPITATLRVTVVPEPSAFTLMVSPVLAALLWRSAIRRQPRKS